jgi:hypothetical protein
MLVTDLTMVKQVIRRRLCLLLGHQHAPVYDRGDAIVVPMFCERCGRNTGRRMTVTADMVGREFMWAPRHDRPWGG